MNLYKSTVILLTAFTLNMAIGECGHESGSSNKTGAAKGEIWPEREWEKEVSSEKSGTTRIAGIVNSGEVFPPQPELDSAQPTDQERRQLQQARDYIFSQLTGKQILTQDEEKALLSNLGYHLEGINMRVTWNYFASIGRFYEWYETTVRRSRRYEYRHKYEFANNEPVPIYEPDFAFARSDQVGFPQVCRLANILSMIR